MLKSLRIGPKLYGGFGVILVLLIILGVTSSVQMASIGDTFSDYRNLARSANEVGRVQANLLLSRMSVKDFIIQGDDASIRTVHENIKTTQGFIDTTEALTQDAEHLALLEQMRKQVSAYQTAFEEVTALQAKRNALFHVLVTVGPQMEQALTEIMRTAQQDDDTTAAYYAGLTLRTLLLGRLYATKFDSDNAQSSADRASQELDAMDEATADLVARLTDPRRAALAQEAAENSKTYHDTFKAFVTVINDRNRIITGTLDVIGSQVANRIETFKLAVKTEQDTLGPEAVAAINQTIIITLVIAMVAVVIGVSAAWIIGSGITKPIQGMTTAMERLSHKDYTVEIPAQDHKDEVGEMAKAVEIFKDSMEKADTLAAEQAAEVKKREAHVIRIEELNHAFDQGISGILEAVAAAATQLHSSAESMASIAEETNSQATTVAAASEQASANVQTVASAAEELSASISEIGRQVQQSSDIAQQAASEADRTNAVISGLADAAQKIGEVVDLITDIADQTNLLALNATIEAARAGDAGKGFAVVANEVKSLATQTAKATGDISRQISAVQAETKTAVSAIGGISEIINRINEVAGAIASAVEQQDAATQEIARNVQQASQGTSEVSHTIVGVTEAAREAGSAAENVLSATSSLNEQSNSLKRMVERFLADVRTA